MTSHAAQAAAKTQADNDAMTAAERPAAPPVTTIAATGGHQSAK